HSPLNQYLHRIGISDSPRCPHCPETIETAPHFLLDCPHYARERHILSNALRRKANSLTFLLTSEAATSPLMRFVDSTGRFKKTFGEISDV
ncbi:hypothetical protein BDR04DRAFT_975605, partial [Suillus decipiens]